MRQLFSENGMHSVLRFIRKKLVLGSINRGPTIPVEYLEKYRELVHLKRHLADLNINYVFDVGANTGQFASDLRMIGYDGEMVSFEPVSSTYEQLCSNFKDDSKWTGFNFALGLVDGQAEIHITAESNMASVRNSTRIGEVLSSERVTVRRLEQVVDELVDVPDEASVFLKIDTQGFDTEVFRGAGDFIKRVSLLMSEVSVIPLYEGSTEYKDALSLYEAEGFGLCNLVTVSSDQDGRVVELNALMRRTALT